MATEIHLDGGLGVRELPRTAECEPGVGLLDLTPIDEGLAEDPVLVANAVADTGDAHGGQGIDEAGGEPTQAAVAEAGFDLLGAQGGQVEATGGHGPLGDLVEVRGHQGVAELAAEQVLRRQVADDFGLGGAVVAQGLQPAGHQVVADGAREREVLVVDGGTGQRHALAGIEFAKELTDEAVDREGR